MYIWTENKRKLSNKKKIFQPFSDSQKIGVGLCHDASAAPDIPKITPISSPKKRYTFKRTRNYSLFMFTDTMNVTVTSSDKQMLVPAWLPTPFFQFAVLSESHIGFFLVHNVSSVVGQVRHAASEGHNARNHHHFVLNITDTSHIKGFVYESS